VFLVNSQTVKNEYYTHTYTYMWHVHFTHNNEPYIRLRMILKANRFAIGQKNNVYYYYYYYYFTRVYYDRETAAGIARLRPPRHSRFFIFGGSDCGPPNGRTAGSLICGEPAETTGN